MTFPFPIRSHVIACLFLLAATSLQTGCDREDAERCQDMDAAIQAKGEQLPSLCNQDIDCVLVDTFLPTQPAASNATPSASDPELDELRTRRIEICGPFDTASTTFRAVCNEGTCEAVATGVAPSPDAGTDADNDTSGPDTGECACATTSDCAGLEICVEGCTCEPICANACARVEECGLLEELGLGSNVPNCVARCDVALQSLGRAPIACIPDAACGDVADCLN